MSVILKTIVAGFLSLSLFGCNQIASETTQNNSVVENIKQETTWQAIQGEGVVLSLPSSYAGGNPNTDLDEIEAKLKAINPSYDERIQIIKQNPTAIALIAFDSENHRQDFLTSVNITNQDIGEGTSLEENLENVTKQLTNIFEIESQQIMTINQYPTAKIVTRAKIKNSQIKQLFYLIQAEENLWIISYTTTVTEFSERLSDFEKSITTFQIQS